MAEAIVSLVAERLTGLLVEEVNMLKGVRVEFQRLKKELISIQGFLKTVDSIHNPDPGFCIWVAEVRDIAYDVDDIIDNFLLQENEKEGLNYNYFQCCAPKLRNIFKLHKSGKDIKEIFSKLDDISQRRKRYETTNVHDRPISSNTNEMLLRCSYPHKRDDDIIGLEDQKRSLVAELLKEEERLRVVSIYGMGGLGKTTLAKEVYNHSNVKSHFNCYAWTSVSQQMNARDVLQEILRKVSNISSLEIGSMKEAELIEKIYANLEGKRYLVVLDDIWSTQDWDVLNPAFPNSKGSKIMFTTRNKEVGEHADRLGCHYEPQCLTDEEAWELLCRKGFPPNVINSICSLSSDKEKCGRDMVKKCGGLPLAIIVLGGILQSKRSLDEWEVVSKKVARGESSVLFILALSYMELPYHLKPLFIYLGLFPEDSIITVKKLVHMWMVECLIKGQEGETIEEVGRQYLNELTNRCMVQIDKQSRREHRTKTCRLHDKMRDLCIDIGKKENFFEVINQQNRDSASSSSSVCSKLRRCSMYIEDKGEQYVFPKHLTPCLRTVFFIPNGSFEYCPHMVYKDFKLLKVLVLQGDLKLEVANEACEVLSKLSNLKYLEVTAGKTNLMCNELHQLRHLYGHERMELLQIKKMTKLQTLYGVSAGPWITDLRVLKNIETLRIFDLTKETVRLLTIAIGGGGLDKLRSLYLTCVRSIFDREDVFSSDLLEALSVKGHLQKLNLNGIIENEKLPSQFPSNLVKISLSNAELLEDPMPTLEKLQHLLFLCIDWYSYSGVVMECSANGFPKLQHLQLCRFYELEEWTVEEGAMPCLTTCEINQCNYLERVPPGFKFLTMLQELRIINMPKSFEQRVKEGGEDWGTIKHIPSITVTRESWVSGLYNESEEEEEEEEEDLPTI